MDPKVLVLSNSHDGIHTDCVLEHLVAMGQPYFRLDVDKLSTGLATVNVRSTPSSFDFEFRDGSNFITSREVGSAWYRRPFTNLSHVVDLDERAHAKKELENLLEGLWRTISDVYWVSQPAALEKARRKMFQLKLAREAGFRVPRTIVTNDPETAREFISSCKDGAVYKTIHLSYIEAGDDGYAVPTTVVTPELVDQLDIIRNSPSLFQERIRKHHELRVTVVGRQIFAVYINSQKFEETTNDWRHPDHLHELDYRPVELPREVADSMLVMMTELGLQFGAFDLAVDPEGQYWFFEINGNGQWYWLEHATDLLISKAVADILTLSATRSSSST